MLYAHTPTLVDAAALVLTLIEVRILFNPVEWAFVSPGYNRLLLTACTNSSCLDSQIFFLYVLADSIATKSFLLAAIILVKLCSSFRAAMLYVMLCDHATFIVAMNRHLFETLSNCSVI